MPEDESGVKGRYNCLYAIVLIKIINIYNFMLKNTKICGIIKYKIFF
jgi:hypothetical protein